MSGFSFAGSSSSFDPAAPGPIGGTTPGSGAFTTLSASGAITSGADITAAAASAVYFSGRSRIRAPTVAAQFAFENSGGTLGFTLGVNATELLFGGIDQASVSAKSIRAYGVRVGTDSNAAGADLTIASGVCTGNATPSSLIFSSWAPVASGSTTQTKTEGLRIQYGVAIFPATTVANLPAAANVPYGRRFVSDATSPTFGATVSGGGAVKTPVWSDGTNWVVG